MNHQSPPASEHNEHRVIFAVLSEQVAALRDHIDNGVTFDLLWRASDRMSWLSRLVLDLSRRIPAMDQALHRECQDAATTIAEIQAALDQTAFLQAQRHDMARQIAECVVTALQTMAVNAASPNMDNLFSSSDLAALYVSEGQRKLHQLVVSRLTAPATD